MRFNEYQKQAIAFRAKDLTDRESKLTMALGLCSESGEAGDMVKKHIGHGHEMDKQALCKELGDALWYIAAVGDEYGISLNEIALGNLKKLHQRYKSGKFTSEESKNRKEISDIKKDLSEKIKDTQSINNPVLPENFQKWKEIFYWRDVDVRIISAKKHLEKAKKKIQEKQKNFKFDPRLIVA